MNAFDASGVMIPCIAEDGSVFPMEKIAAHRAGVPHKAVSVFVFDGDRLLIQRRALSKYHGGGLWANTCCTHPFMDEDPGTCAARRLREELGISVPLEPRGQTHYRAPISDGLIEDEHVDLFVGFADAETLDITLNGDEVDAVLWITLDDLRRRVESVPDVFTPWLRIYLERLGERVFAVAAE